MRIMEASTLADLTRRVAEDYRARGYDVIIHPQSQQLPEPLADFQPDIVARKGDETVVIEVKSRQALRREPHIEPLVRAVQNVPGARFELVIAKPDISSPLPERTRPWRNHEATSALDEATRLLEEGHPSPPCCSAGPQPRRHCGSWPQGRLSQPREMTRATCSIVSSAREFSGIGSINHCDKPSRCAMPWLTA